MPGFLTSKTSRTLSIVLLAQAGVFYGFSRQENVPLHRPLEQFQLPGSSWISVEDMPLDKETLDVLRADDILSRLYRSSDTGTMATMFVAYFQTQRTGKTPHSPKNCLPGSGWVPSESGDIHISVPGEQGPITVNHYVVSRGDNQSVVLYWYQSHNRIVASEYWAKFYTVADAIRYNRSDTALVRVVIPVSHADTRSATDQAVTFVQSFFEPLKAYLSS
ncbi:MAG: EpsI family protein [Acidobacteriaceae bacterium]|nr:EpsI family protein [Acidobacteriaceae bacterium]